MIRYVAGKLLLTLISLWILSTATFFMMKAIPGDPFTSEKQLPAGVREQIMAHYGFDRPLLEQYQTYMVRLLAGDLGVSMKQQHQSVADIIEGGFANSMRLGLVALLLSVTVGIALGSIAAMYHRKLGDGIAIVLSVAGLSIPNFVLAIVLQYAFGERLGLFHVAGLHSLRDVVLPALALSALPIAFIARLTRSGMLEALHADYIKTARAKGLAPWEIVFRHALRNALIPVLTYLGPMAAGILTGSIVIESIFGIPGLGQFFVSSVTSRDYTLIMGLTLFYGALLMGARLLTDLAYLLVDPRMKASLKGAS